MSTHDDTLLVPPPPEKHAPPLSPRDLSWRDQHRGVLVTTPGLREFVVWDRETAQHVTCVVLPGTVGKVVPLPGTSAATPLVRPDVTTPSGQGWRVSVEWAAVLRTDAPYVVIAVEPDVDPTAVTVATVGYRV